MTRDLQIIGDKIEFMGWHVGNLTEVPATIRAQFEDLLNGYSRECFRPPYVSYASHPKLKAKR